MAKERNSNPECDYPQTCKGKLVPGYNKPFQLSGRLGKSGPAWHDFSKVGGVNEDCTVTF